MKKFSFIAAAAILSAAGALSAQTILNTTLLDGFDTDTSGDWVVTNGNPVGYNATDSQTGSGGSLVLNDGGYSFGAAKTYTGQIVTPGSYRTTFYWKNGPDSTPGVSTSGLFEGTDIQMNGNNVLVDFIPIDPTESLTWTQETTNSVVLPAGDLDWAFVAQSSSGATITAQLDEITLEEIENLPQLAQLAPLENSRVDDVKVLSVLPSGGSGNYTSVSFDVGNDATVEHVDSTPGDGFTFSFDTTGLVDGPVDIAISITDDVPATGTTVVTYTVDNTKGVQELFFDGFESGFTAGIPNGWTRVDIDSAGAAAGSPQGVAAENTVNPYSGASALQITYAANPDPNRYTLASTPFAGEFGEYQLALAGMGSSFTRAVLFFSTDGGTTWESEASTLIDPGATASVWGTGIDLTPAGFFPSGSQVRVGTHFYGTGEGNWDNIRVTASEVLEVNDWDLY